MKKKTTRKSKSTKNVKSLPVKSLGVKQAKGVRGGGGTQEPLKIKLTDVRISSYKPYFKD